MKKFLVPVSYAVWGRVVGELCDNGKEDFAFTLSGQMIWEDFNIWYNDATKGKRNLDEVVKYLELAKKVL